MQLELSRPRDKGACIDAFANRRLTLPSTTTTLPFLVSCITDVVHSSKRSMGYYQDSSIVHRIGYPETSLGNRVHPSEEGRAKDVGVARQPANSQGDSCFLCESLSFTWNPLITHCNLSTYGISEYSPYQNPRCIQVYAALRQCKL